MVGRQQEEWIVTMERFYPDSGHIINVTFQVTDGCNLRCSYCYQINKSTHVMTWEVAKQFCDYLLSTSLCDYSDTPVDGMIVEFIGGEPLLAIDLIDKITDYLFTTMIELNHPWIYKTRLSICSNGTLYFQPKVQEYIKKYNHFLSLGITLDGNKELHDMCRLFPDGTGSYDKALAATLDAQKKYRQGYGTKLTLAPANVGYTFAAIKNFIDLGFENIHLNCAYEKGWELEHAKILYDQLILTADYIIENNLADKVFVTMFDEHIGKPIDPNNDQNWCGGNGRMVACDWRGDLYPCIRYMESSLGDSQPPLKIGDIYKGIGHTAQQRELINDLQSVTRSSQSTEECYYCPIGDGCAWCSGYNYQATGSYNKRATYICVMHKARSLANVYYWNMKYLYYNEPRVYHNWCPEEWAIPIIGEEEWLKLQVIEDMAADGERLITPEEEEN